MLQKVLLHIARYQGLCVVWGEGVTERVEGEREDVWESEREGCVDLSLLPQAK